MKILTIAGHPLLQLFSFCILLVGSPYFGGPYIFFLYHGLTEIHAWAVFGVMGILITVCALFFSGRGAAVLQFIGLVMMVVSLLVFELSADSFMNIWVWRQSMPLLTLALFGFICGIVVRKFLKAGGL